MLRCIRCGADSAEHAIEVNVHDAGIYCTNCEDTYTALDVRAVMAAWGPVLDWIDAHPSRAEINAKIAACAAAAKQKT